MAEPAGAGADAASGPDQAGLSMQLDALRAAGAPGFDPVRFRFLEALADRLQFSQDAVRPILQAKLRDALEVFDERMRHAPQGPAGAAVPAVPAAHPLADLNRYLRTVAQGGADAPDGTRVGEEALELNSLRRFRESWSRMAAEDQVDQAVLRGPGNAGPLNAHSLVLRSLALMRALSPEYLRRFVSQVDTLLWLEQADRRHKDKVRKAAPARPARRRK